MEGVEASRGVPVGKAVSQRRLLKLVGKDTTGKDIYHGVFAFYETHGLPLSDMLFHMWERNGLPDFVQLIADMQKAGRPHARCLEAVSSAVHDACYPVEVRDAIVSRLKLLEKKEE